MTGIRYDRLAPNIVAKIIPRRGRPKAERNLRDLLLPGCTYTDSGSSRSSGIRLNLRNTNGELFSDPDLTRRGTVISFSYGYPGLMYDAGHFVIKNHSGQGNTLSIDCKPRKRSRMTRKKLSRSWDRTKRSVAVREVLALHFPASAIYIDETDREIDTIRQTGEHDWQFVQRQAHLASREFYVDARGVHWEKPRRNQSPSRLLRYIRNPIGVGEIVSPPSFEGLGAGIPGRVVLKGRDIFTKKPFEAVVKADNAEEFEELTIVASASDPEEGDQQDGGDTGHEIVRSTSCCTLEEATEQANVIYKFHRYGALKMTLQTVGDPTMRSRTVTLVWGVGLALDGLWWAKTVRHTFGPGYQQSIELTREDLAKRLKLRGKKKILTAPEEIHAIAHQLGGALAIR